MRRKVIQIADSTQLVSLPRKWALKHGIKKGDELEVEEDGSKIIVSTEKGQKSDNIEVDITGLDRDSLMFLIRVLYIKGYDEIKIKFSKAVTIHHKINKEVSVISAITEEAKRLNGIEVIEQENNFCIIKEISEGTIQEFDNILKRIFLLLIAASNNLLEGVRESKFVLLDNINEKHDTITTFTSYNLRLLNKFGYHESGKSNLFYHITFSLDEIIDIIKYTARYIGKNKIEPSKETMNILHMIHQTLSLYHELFYKFDLKKIEKISQDRSLILDKIETLMRKVSSKDIFILTSMEQILEIIIHLINSRLAIKY